MSQLPDTSRPPLAVTAVDATLGAALAVSAVSMAIATEVGRMSRPFLDMALRPQLLPEPLWPQTYLDRLADRGWAGRQQAGRRISRLLDELVPVVLDAVLDRIDLTELVLQRVDIDRIVATVDLDAVVARLDLSAIIESLPLDEIVSRVDINAIASRVDVNGIASRLDLNAVASRIDVDEIVARVDIDTIIDRIDLASIANQVIEDIDLSEIIRGSTGAMASETVLGVRMQGIQADDRVNRVVDKLLLRRRERDTAAPRPLSKNDAPRSDGDHER